MSHASMLRMNTCAAEACNVVCARHHLMCLPHWRLVPAALQREVWDTWKAWNRKGGSANHEAYKAARDAAIAAVREKELKKHLKNQQHGDNLVLDNGNDSGTEGPDRPARSGGQTRTEEAGEPGQLPQPTP